MPEDAHHQLMKHADEIDEDLDEVREELKLKKFEYKNKIFS